MMQPPTSEEIRDARKAVGLTQAQAAELVHASLNGWHQWEKGLRPMGLAHWELFLIKTGQAADK
ncbi:MAG: helix-turn-helix transcriptional regulator [Laribacter sp.]|nr:helix-turn-helix transcriptional regulator [Laribacter sp.]MBP9527571.1 helix-turn-helix transcriptional regulator [Laribacter sp.]MBP9608530.1 helix-turn-helix transcriptional regulator [Laribacter sp.]